MSIHECVYLKLFTQGIRRSYIGNYSCSATNDIGQGISKPVKLDIKCKLSKIIFILIINILEKYLFLSDNLNSLDAPACAEDQRLVYEAAKQQSVKVKCLERKTMCFKLLIPL